MDKKRIKKEKEEAKKQAEKERRAAEREKRRLEREEKDREKKEKEKAKKEGKDKKKGKGRKEMVAEAEALPEEVSAVKGEQPTFSEQGSPVPHDKSYASGGVETSHDVTVESVSTADTKPVSTRSFEVNLTGRKNCGLRRRGNHTCHALTRVSPGLLGR
jgi:hypothetical protein